MVSDEALIKLKPHTLEEVPEWEARCVELEKHLQQVEQDGAAMDWNGEDPAIASQRYVSSGRQLIANILRRIDLVKKNCT